MKHTLLISGNRGHFTTLTFAPDKGDLRVLAQYPAPFNASWIEPSSSQGGIDRLVGLSEGTESGSLYTFEIDHAQETCRITSQRPTLGAPAHFTTLHDNSALALVTYLGGSFALYPIFMSDTEGLLLVDALRTEILPKFPYKAPTHGPNEVRQLQCHLHQILEDQRGLLYAPDLGSDRVWIFRRNHMKLKLCGWLQCPPGTGPRHAVMTSDETIMYVIGELSHTVVAFNLPTSPAEAIQPVQGFVPNIIPTNVHPDHQFMMDSAEICRHPNIPNVLYVSNRWEKHISQREPHLKNVPSTLASGDDVAIILVSDDGKKVESMKHVRTNVDVIRGMRVSEDGNYVVVVGQDSGGVEIYGISGRRGDAWTLIAGLNEGLEGGIKHAIWL